MHETKISNFTTLTAEQLLELQDYTQLFKPDPYQLAKEYRRLTMKWHPELTRHWNPEQASQVFNKIKDLYGQARNHLSYGSWLGVNLAAFETQEGEYYLLHYNRKDEYQGDTVQYVMDDHVVYHIPESELDQAEIWTRNLKKFQGQIGDVEGQNISLNAMKGLKFESIRLKDDGVLLKFEKPARYLCLAHILQKYELGLFECGWIVGTLMAMASKMLLSDTPNIDICSSGVFIDTQAEQLVLLSGWQYCDSFDRRAVDIPRRTSRRCPTLTETGTPNGSDACTHITAIGREILERKFGHLLHPQRGLETKVSNWLTGTHRTIVISYGSWLNLAEKYMRPPENYNFRPDPSVLYPSPIR